MGGLPFVREDIAAITMEFSKRCLSLVDINQLLEKITYIYVEAGYILARAYLPEQDLSQKTLKILVVEGSLEKIESDKEQGDFSLQKKMAFPGLINKPVNLRDIEQGLDQINRLGRNNMQTDFHPGTQSGQTILYLKNQPQSPWQINYTTDNKGSESTGETQASLSFIYDDPIGLNDQLSLSYQRGLADDAFDFDNDDIYSQYGSFTYSVPYGYWLYTLSASRSNYESEVEGSTEIIKTHGNSRNSTLTAARVLFRDQLSKTTLSGNLSYSANESYVAGELLETSSRKLSVGEMSLSHTHRFGNASTSFSLTYHQGLDIFDAFDDDAADAGSPKGQFTKFTSDISYRYPFIFSCCQLSYSGRLHLQASDDLLFSSEQVFIGGASSVRGTDMISFAGNRGGYIQNELSLGMNGGEGLWGKFMQGVSLFMTADFGHIAEQKIYDIESDDMGSLGIGARGGWGFISYDIYYADLVYVTSDLPTKGVFSGSFSFSF